VSEDYDGDGRAETRREELTGLVDTSVTLTWLDGTSPLEVTALSDLPW
jgi:hypothetical protein